MRCGGDCDCHVEHIAKGEMGEGGGEVRKGFIEGTLKAEVRKAVARFNVCEGRRNLSTERR